MNNLGNHINLNFEFFTFKMVIGIGDNASFACFVNWPFP